MTDNSQFHESRLIHIAGYSPANLEGLGRASVDRHHAWRTPVLATVGCDGSPNARTVVLRKVDTHQQTLCFYTDARSAKVNELKKEPKAVLAFWSGRLNWQLRVKVEISVATDGPELQALW